MSDPIQLFKDELNSVDIGKRRQSMKRLVDIAKAAGPDAAREKLIPFVQDRIDDDDEVLFEMATQLGDLGELVGGPKHEEQSLESPHRCDAVRRSR